MQIAAERLDYLWFLGLGLDDPVPDHSVLSKARTRWGREVFEKLFIKTVSQCVEAGLVSGEKIHVDGSLIDADASKRSVLKGPPELMEALKAAYEAQEEKLCGHLGNPYYQPVNKGLMSTSDPDAALVRHKPGSPQGESRPRWLGKPVTVSRNTKDLQINAYKLFLMMFTKAVITSRNS